MEGRVSYLAVGLFIVALVVAAISVFFWLTLRKHDQSYSTYVVYLHEEVSGLSVQSSVRYNGVPVGYVKSINLVPSNPQLVQVLLDIESDAPINTSTVATLMSQGLTGVDYIGLQAQRVNAPRLVRHPGEEYPVIPSRPSLLVQLSAVMPQITQKITQLSDNISRLFDKKNTDSIAATLQNIQVFTATLKNNSDEISRSMNSLDQLLQHAQIASKGLPELVQTTTSAMKELHNTAQLFGDTAKTTSQTLVTGQAAINNLTQQLLPSAQQVLQQLNNIEVNLQDLSTGLKRDPSMLVRGKQPAVPGPGER